MVSSCPYCRAPFEPGEDLTACPGCGTPHHTDCLEENHGCTVFGCSNAPVEEAKINISTQDVNTLHPQQFPVQPYPQQTYPTPQSPTAVPSQPFSFLNLQTTAPAPAPDPSAALIPAPPPRPEDWAASNTAPPTQLNVQGYPPYPAPYTIPSNAYTPTFSGYAQDPYIPAPYPAYYAPRKSRVVFVLLAVFLGPFGGHNFYAGYTTKAIIQLCLTLLTCFIGSFVSWIWAIVEACIIEVDSDGIAFV